MRTPAEVFAPGEFISEELEARGWSQVELAEIMLRPARLISELVAGKRAITPETAKGLGAAFGTGPEFWMNLERDYLLARAVHDDAAVQRRAHLYEMAPIKEMAKRKWIEPSDNVAVLETRVQKFFQVDDLGETLSLPHAARKSGSSTGKVEVNSSLRAWLLRVKQIANAISVPAYSMAGLQAALSTLETLMVSPEEVRHVPAVLSNCGVRLVIVEKLPQAKIDGACFWLNDESPVVGMSIRRDTIDNFWFVLRHELEHVLRGDGKNDCILDDLEGQNAGDGEELPSEERIANVAASEYCAPRLESFMARKHPFYYERDVLAFSQTISRHPGIVVGQMQFRLQQYAYLTKHLAKIRNSLLPASIYDGWGQVPSI